tara:strand:- start:2177 stop:3343 length:1167 start_codon:yes stop_codon:yes gene_type:complete
MAYGKIKADAFIYDNSGTDEEVALSGIPSASDLNAKAPLASPDLTGTPTAPTAAVGTNTTQIATTAFVLANGSSAYELETEGTKYKIEFIAIGGGGAGGYTDSGYAGGGGGAGGLAYHNGFMVTDGDAYTVNIGSGALGPASDSQLVGPGSNYAPNGGDTEIIGPRLFVQAYGGGGGAGYNGSYTTGAAGGCGGGSEGHGPNVYWGGESRARGASGGTSSLGHPGGGSNNGTDQGDGSTAAGGGGGVGGGPDAWRSHGGDGTPAFHDWLSATSTGTAHSINSNSIRYIGGGGAGGEANSTGGTGGRGGAGNGGNSSGSSGGDATDGTGSGGGGRGRWDQGSGRGGNGGDGLVIFRYRDSDGQKASGGTVTQSGGYYYHVFTSSNTFTA